PHHVAKSQNEGDSVEIHDNFRTFGELAHHGDELKIDEFFPHVKSGDEEIVDARDGGRLKKQLRLGAAFLAGNEYFGDGGRFRIREHAVHVANEIASQRNQEENAEAAAGETDEDGLERMRIELENIERGQSENRACDHAACDAADAGNNHV